jgi:tetratricopeptide (TPR) repeat protein
MCSKDDPLLAVREGAVVAYREEREAVVIELLAPYLQSNPHDAYAWFMYGDALRVVGRSSESEKALLQALELETSKRTYICSRIASLYSEMGRHADAERYYAEVTSDPAWQSHGWAWILRGGNLAALGNFTLAEECHRKAIEVGDCDVDEAWLNVGLVLRAQRRYAEAIDAIRRSIEIDPSSDMARKALRSMEGIDAATADASNI